jgi:anion-transporting  ArsA/GET3 family ATPase
MRQPLFGKKTLVCVGPGGVGKTTTAAAFGVIGARAGLRTLVCTIDPAPRLADALGVPGLAAQTTPIAAATASALGVPAPGLYAMRVDPGAAFASLVREQVADPELRDHIFANPLYRQVTTELTGSHEYAATLALFELRRSGAYDLIVLDTPPTANALEFLETPQRLAQAIASPAVQWFARPDPKTSRLTSRFSLRRLGMGGASIIRRAGKLMGNQFLDDLGAFLLDIRQVLGGFLLRAREIEAVLKQPDVGFVLVMTPETAAVDEALAFGRRLRATGVSLCGYVANRTLTQAGSLGADAIAQELAALPGAQDLAGEATLTKLTRLASYLDTIARAQERELERLARESPGLDITTIPLLAHDVSNLESLRAIADRLESG